MGDRRSIVFLVFAAMSFTLLPAAEPEYRWVCVVTGTAYVVLAIASALDAASRGRR